MHVLSNLAEIQKSSKWSYCFAGVVAPSYNFKKRNILWEDSVDKLMWWLSKAMMWHYVYSLLNACLPINYVTQPHTLFANFVLTTYWWIAYDCHLQVYCCIPPLMLLYFATKWVTPSWITIKWVTPSWKTASKRVVQNEGRKFTSLPYMIAWIEVNRKGK